MIPKECKRLAEVDFPIAVVSRHAAREKSIRHGHPSTLHLWWARRPLASSRALLMALLLPDPCDQHCPEEFKTKARALLPQAQGTVGAQDEDLRRELLRFIGDFAKWDLSSNSTYLEVARGLVNAAHPEAPPLVVDPFAGGGSIPLEALRLGCEAFASDLNPVACLILKVMLEDIPRHGPKLADELRRVGAEIKEKAERELADLYPKDPDGATPIAYLWARTVKCEAPKCGAEVPIFKSGWLSTRGVRRARYFHEAAAGGCSALLVGASPPGGPVTFRIARGHGSSEPRPGFIRLQGTKAPGNNANVICPCCGVVLSGDRKNARTAMQLSAQRGGADVTFDVKGQRSGGARLLAVVTPRLGGKGRGYRLPSDQDYAAVRKAQERLATILDEWEREGSGGVCPVPDEPLPPPGTLGFRVQRYGMLNWGDLFTARQKVALITHVRLQREATGDAPQGFLMIGKMADTNSAVCTWQLDPPRLRATFTRQALPMTWDFAEACPLGTGAGNYGLCVEAVSEVVERLPKTGPGTVERGDACALPLPGDAAAVYFTDPPYYDAIPYSDLSDFFFVWLKRTLPESLLLRDPNDAANRLTPKALEIVQDETKRFNGRPKDRAFFETRMGRAFADGRRILSDDGVGAIVFAHKTTEGWEALLSGMVSGGWVITGSWPVATELKSRNRARDSAALATSVHLICRPRRGEAPVGDWAVVLRELPGRVGDWMERLQGEGIRGADLVFACIGPALEIYSRYSKVVDAEERDIPLGGNSGAKAPHERGYLAYVWEAVGRAALAQVLGTAEAKARNGAAGAVEEDARLTALFLWTLQSTGGEAEDNASDGGEDVESTDDDDDEEGSSSGKAKGFTLVFDVVRRFAQPLGIDLPKWEGRVIETKKGVVRLLPIGERAKQLFGEDGAQAVAARLEQEAAAGTDPLQGMLFPDLEVTPKVRGRGRGRGTLGDVDVSDESLAAAREATTLDRVHAAMLLQAGGRTNALRALLKAEQERGSDFLRLANAFSALYPKGSEEKRLTDAMLLAVPK
jgi:putative DNA methylase